MATEKGSYLSRERKHNADYMRKSGNGDTLATRKSVGRKGEALRKKTHKLSNRVEMMRDSVQGMDKPKGWHTSNR